MPPPCPGLSPPDPARAMYIPPAGSHAIPRGAARPLATRLIPPLLAIGGVGVPVCAATEAAMGSSASTTRTRTRNLCSMTTSPSNPAGLEARCGSGLPVLDSLDNDGALHAGVVLADVGVGAGGGEGEGVALSRVEV